MNISNKERFLGICRFERPGDLILPTPYFEDFWGETLKEWIKQGAPQQIMEGRFRGAYFQLDHLRILHEVKLGIFLDRKIDLGGGVIYNYPIPPIVPAYDSKVMSEDEHTITLINEGGQKVKVFKDNPDKMPMFLDHPVKDRSSWEEYKKRLNPHTPERLPSNLSTYAQKINGLNDPTMLCIAGFFGPLREWMGLETLLYMFYDDPKLIEDMMDQVCYLLTESVKSVVNNVAPSCVMFWEDMAYKAGPLISPDMFKKFMMPRYKKITSILQSAGIDVVFVDSDGNINELIPLWLECGVNGFWPLECAAGNDAVALRKKYGKNIILTGNIDKRELIKGKDAIRSEVMSKVPYLLKTGGYIPSVDHLVPPDMTLENFRYFLNTLREVAGLEKLPQ